MRRHRPEVSAALIARFNAQWPVGSACTVIKDLGGALETRTRSTAWGLGDGSPVVMVEGISGGYALERVIPHRDGGARREMVHRAGALLRDRAAELERQAEENARESDSPADQGEAGLLKDIACEVEKLSAAVYALGDPPKTEAASEVDGDIRF